MAMGAPNPGNGSTLIVGSTGFMGRFIAEAFLAAGLEKPTYLLVRPGAFSPAKAQIIKAFGDQGATIVQGSITDQDFMVKLLKEREIEVVVSAIGGGTTSDQLVLVQAIKAAGSTVKRFLPSEFGHDIDRADPVEPGLSMYKEKRKVRRAAEEAGIPYTYICCNSIAAWPYHYNTHPADVIPPLDRFQIYGDGSVKAYFVAGKDIGKLTVRCSRDPLAVNKTVHFRPAKNLLCMDELASLWEKKIGRTLPRVTITEDDLLAAADEMRIPESVVAALTHDIFIKGCQTNFSIDKPTDVEVSSLYPDMSFRSVEDCFDDFVPKLVGISTAVINGLKATDGVVMQKPMREVLAIRATGE